MAEDLSLDASNANEIQQAVVNVMTRHAVTRPENTIKQYKRKQDDFSDWCAGKTFFDGSLVYESKLVDYLDSFVIPRGNKRKKNADGSAVGLGYEAVDAYVNAIIDLYQFQKSIKMNQHSHPRGKALKGLMDMLSRGENKRMVETYADRGLGTVLHGYNLEDMKALSKFWLKLPTGVALRSRVDFFVGHALLARGESRRFIQLPDMLSLSLTDEGPQLCSPLVVIMRKGKSNQVGRVEYGATMRCKEVLLCPLNAVAMYLFWRWHVDLEPFPNFTDRKKWYDIRLLKGKTATRDIAYNTQLECVKSAFAACGIDSSVWTHANRGSGAKLAELQGADENQIRRAGRWNGERMEACYLIALPRKAMRALAGFSTKGGDYWINRASSDLQKMIFPSLDDVEGELRNSGNREIAAGGFIGLLHVLRTVFLQDSVLLRRKFPDHRLWKDPIFSLEQYTTFDAELMASLHSANQPQDTRLESAIPLVASSLKAGFEALHGKIDSLASEVHQIKEHSLLNVDKRLVISLKNDEEDQQYSSVARPRGLVASRPPGLSTISEPELRLSRSLQTVDELWLEYTRGISGQMSVQEAEKRFGSKWRKDPTENRFFSRRKVFYEAIKTFAAKCEISEAAAAEELEKQRTAVFGKHVRSIVQNHKPANSLL